MLTGGEAMLADFKRMCREDTDFSNGLMNLGIFDTDEVDPNGYDEDLDNEIRKDNVENDEHYDNRKKGIEAVQQMDGGIFAVEKVGGGDQFMAVKPWAGTVRKSVPSNYKKSKDDGEAPDSKLKLEYVHGYRCHDTRNNIRYTPSGKIVYHTAAVGIVMSSDGKDQKFMFEHQDDIMCLDSHGELVVTGEIGNKPVLCLWDCEKVEPIATMVGALEKGISNVCFSHDGLRIAALSMDSDHTLAVFDV